MSLLSRHNVFDIDRFFSDARPQQVQASVGTFFTPRVDITDADDHYEITAELPGVDKKDIQVQVKEGILTLEAQTTKVESLEKQGKVIRQERRYGKYKRSFNLGTDVREGDIKAIFKDGVLTLQAPKVVEKVQEPRRIEVL